MSNISQKDIQERIKDLQETDDALHKVFETNEVPVSNIIDVTISKDIIDEYKMNTILDSSKTMNDAISKITIEKKNIQSLEDPNWFSVSENEKKEFRVDVEVDEKLKENIKEIVDHYDKMKLKEESQQFSREPLEEFPQCGLHITTPSSEECIIEEIKEIKQEEKKDIYTELQDVKKIDVKLNKRERRLAEKKEKEEKKKLEQKTKIFSKTSFENKFPYLGNVDPITPEIYKEIIESHEKRFNFFKQRRLRLQIHWNLYEARCGPGVFSMDGMFNFNTFMFENYQKLFLEIKFQDNAIYEVDFHILAEWFEFISNKDILYAYGPYLSKIYVLNPKLKENTDLAQDIGKIVKQAKNKKEKEKK